MEQKKGLIFEDPLIATLIVVFGNLIPLYGVLFWRWEIFDIFYIYWAENVLIGVFVAVRMLLTGAAWGPLILIGTVFNVAFFTVHYGMFTWGHGMIIFEIFYDGPMSINENNEFLFGYILTRGYELFMAMAGLFVVVLIKAIHDIIKDRREAKLPKTIMFSPYGRIVILHMSVLIGGLLAQKLGAPIWALGCLIVLKIMYDVAVIRDVDILHKTETEAE